MHVKYLCRNLNTLKFFNLPQVCCFQKFTISFWKLYLEGSSIRYFCICTIFEDADCCTHILYTQWHDVQCWYFLGKNTPINTLIFQTSGLQTSGHLDFWPSGLWAPLILASKRDIWTSGHPDFWPLDFWSLNFWTSGLLVFRTSGHRDFWSSGLLNIWIYGLLSYCLNHVSIGTF